MELVEIYQHMDTEEPLDGGWMSLGRRAQEQQEIVR
jgi:hypothetical protein